MSEFRRNPLTGYGVILAENRGQRPQEMVFKPSIASDFQCPFCEGQEHRTPSETFAIRSADSRTDGPGWRVRVVPNKFPAISEAISESSGAAGSAQAAMEIAQSIGVQAVGVHEVVVESPNHVAHIGDLSNAQFADVLEAYRQRLGQLRSSGKYNYALIFKNYGIAGGATLSHLHSQLVAANLPGDALDRRSQNFAAFYHERGGCLLCNMIDQELAAGDQMIDHTDRFIAFCPWAARMPYEAWIVPREHGANFDSTSPQSLTELAELFRGVLVKLERIVKVSACNYIIHTGPFDTNHASHYHWHIEILPRTATLAGFELGTGCFINTVPPEKAAQELRKA
ncbi:MAG TPA: DUF4921 family protein [Pirellulales bacterium]|jgi:UDPglucose--hexose-1-phosphate uridylyltransferase